MEYFCEKHYQIISFADTTAIVQSKSTKFQVPTTIETSMRMQVSGQQAAQNKCIGIDFSSCLGSKPPIKVQKYMAMHFSGQLAALNQGTSIYVSTFLGGKLPRTIETSYAYVPVPMPSSIHTHRRISLYFYVQCN